MALLEICGLQVEFGAGPNAVRVVDDVSLAINEGETLGLVGESGCGKSVTALSVARLLPSPPARYAGGKVMLLGRDVLTLSGGDLRRIRGGTVSYVFQDPATSLNPVLRVGTQILESLKIHRPRDASQTEVLRLLSVVGIPDPKTRSRDFPHRLSGGMQQRVMIAIALASGPKLLIADEPTTALDVTIQAQIMDLLRKLQREMGMAIFLITHNLALLGEIADRVGVMYAGQIVEQGPALEVLRNPRHPYTRALIASVPALEGGPERLRAIPGAVPSPGRWPEGCRFAPRCEIAKPDCAVRRPELQVTDSPARLARCPYWKETA